LKALNAFSFLDRLLSLRRACQLLICVKLRLRYYASVIYKKKYEFETKDRSYKCTIKNCGRRGMSAEHFDPQPLKGRSDFDVIKPFVLVWAALPCPYSDAGRRWQAHCVCAPALRDAPILWLLSLGSSSLKRRSEFRLKITGLPELGLSRRYWLSLEYRVTIFLVVSLSAKRRHPRHGGTQISTLQSP